MTISNQNYGLGLGNLTNLDKSKPGEVSQQGAFTVVDLSKTDTSAYANLDEAGCENLAVTGFTFYGLKGWRYRLIKRLALFLKREGKAWWIKKK